MPEGRDELLELLLSPTVRTISIKGRPGTGKTILALELLSRVGSGVYVSTRVSEALLIAQYPHIKPLVERGRVKPLYPETKVEGVRVEDMRLGGIKDILESLIGVLPSVKGGLVVLDSWDALARELDESERLKTERVLATIADSSDLRVVFVSEEPGLLPIDYLVDAIVMLHVEEVDGRIVRCAELEKIRGQQIRRMKVPYTLFGGRFTPLSEFALPTAYEPMLFKAKPHTVTHFSTGSEDLDAMLEGGLRRGGLLLLEYGTHLNPMWLEPLTLSIICNFVANGDAAVIVPCCGITPDMVKDAIAMHVAPWEVESRVRVGHCFDYRTDPCFFRFNCAQPDAAYSSLEAQIRALKGDTKRSCLIVVGLDTLELSAGPDVAASIVWRITSGAKSEGDAVLVVGKPSLKSLALVFDLCEYCLKLDEIHGSLVAYLTKPWSVAHSVSYDYSSGYPEVKLTPVV